jgi:glycosyltransferase involved in cell wall biosynthesis
MEPKVSVCIPTYNQSVYLREAIESVLAQDFEDYELIVVDDCSIDNTPSVVAEYHDRRLRFHRNKKNIGRTGNYNRCLELSRGKYFKLLGHDDRLLPKVLTKAVQVLDQYPEVGLVAWRSEEIDSFGKKTGRLCGSPPSHISKGIVESKWIFRLCVHSGKHPITNPTNFIVRREIAINVGGFDTHYPFGQDGVFSFQIIAKSKFYMLPIPLTQLRMHPLSGKSIEGFRIEALIDNQYCLDLALRFLGEEATDKDRGYIEMHKTGLFMTHALYALRHRRVHDFCFFLNGWWLGQNKIAAAKVRLQRRWKTLHKFIFQGKLE